MCRETATVCMEDAMERLGMGHFHLSEQVSLSRKA